MLPPDVEFDTKMNADGTETAVSMRPLINGASIQKMIGKPATLVGTVISVNPNGLSFDIQTTDSYVVIVSMRKPLTEPISGVVEVQGIVKGKNTMVCDYYMSYPDTLSDSFDNELANRVVMIMHHCQNAWVNN